MSMPSRITAAGLAVLAAVSAPGPGPGPARAAETSPGTATEPIFPHPVHQKKLANGLTVLVVPMPGTGVASVRTVVRTGSRDEYEPGHTGFAHFFEHMMFRGTPRYPQHEREKLVTGMGASNNAYTTDDRTVYEFDIAAADLEKVMDLESDRFMNLSYTPQVFQTEAGAVYGEFRKNSAMPFFQLEEALARTAFTRHTYGHTTMGHEKDIAAMPRMFDYSRKFFARYYRPENTILIVVGDVAPDATLALAERYWGPWKKGYVPPRIPAEPPQRQERRVEVAYPGRTLPLLTLAYKSGPFAPSSVEWVSGLVLAELWFGETSALYKQLVLDERTVQQLMAMPAMNRDPGLFQIVAQVADNRHVDAVRTALDQAIAEARTTAVDPARVREAVSRLRYGFLMGLDTPRAVAGQLAQLTAITGDVAAVEQMYRTLEQVTPDTVKSAAARLFDARRRTVAILREKQS